MRQVDTGDRLSASAVVRCRDEAATIEATLLALRGQTVPVEIIVVDSGSTDGTLELAERLADEIVCIAPHQFSYGRALNIGAERSQGDIVFALSAHCVPNNESWLSDSLKFYRDNSVAATNGALRDPRGKPLRAPYYQTVGDIQGTPYWGFSNHASSWRREVWQDLRFDEQMTACEDKEWSWRVLRAGYTIAYSPRLVVTTGHRRQAGLRSLYQRHLRESQQLASRLDFERMGISELGRRLWNDFPDDSRYPRLVRRASPYRLAELVGRYRGERAGSASGRTWTGHDTG